MANSFCNQIMRENGPPHRGRRPTAQYSANCAFGGWFESRLPHPPLEGFWRRLADRRHASFRRCTLAWCNRRIPYKSWACRRKGRNATVRNTPQGALSSSERRDEHL